MQYSEPVVIQTRSQSRNEIYTHTEHLEKKKAILLFMGAIHSTEISGNLGSKLNGLVWSNRKSFEKTGLPFEVDHFSRSDRSEFWLNESCTTDKDYRNV